jgi:porin
MGKANKYWLRTGLSAAAILAVGIIPGAAHADDTELLGDMSGLRPALGNYGVTLGITDSENFLNNLSGGVKQGGTVQGVTTATLQVDTSKMFGWLGGTFNVSMLQLHGQPFTGPYLDDIQAANGNEGDDATRLWELWYDQKFDNSLADVKIGQQSIDNEFMVSTYSALFVNTMAGWPLIPSDDLYAGGPAYPLSSLGARIQFKAADNQTILAGVFDDNPPGGAFDDDDQSRDAGGTRFNLNTGALFIAEYQYVTNQPAVGQMVGAAPQGLPGTYKLGFWYDTAAFPDQRYGTDGLSLASQDSNGDAKMHKGDYSLYAVVDQTLWQSGGARNLNVFGRIMGAPSDENLISFSFNGGFTMTAPLPGRPNDSAGIDFGLAKVSDRAAGLDVDSGVTRRGTEELIELTYQAQATPWLILQPDFQYIVSPGAGVQDPDDSTHNLHNEIVAGIRAVTTF